MVASLTDYRARLTFVLQNGEKIVYCNEQAVIIRDLKDPSIAELYTEHQVHPTVGMRFWNGVWVDCLG